MNPWLALMIGLWVGFMLGIVAVALAQMAKDKPRPLGYWDGSDEQVVFTPDGDWRYMEYPWEALEDGDPGPIGGEVVEINGTRYARREIPVRRAPYDWKAEEYRP